MRSQLALSGPQAEAPPDATFFSAGGVDYYLYMGVSEMRALQREWGLAASPSDSTAEVERKSELFYARLDGKGIMEDYLALIRAGLTRWQASQPQTVRRRAMTNDDVAKLLEDLEPDAGDEKKAVWLRIRLLVVRFLKDMFGWSEAKPEGEGDPKSAPTGEASTLSGS
jgi:hypothetical protein